MKLLQIAFCFVVALCMLTIVGAMFGGPILLAYDVATVQGLLLTMLCAGIVGIACGYGVIQLDD